MKKLLLVAMIFSTLLFSQNLEAKDIDIKQHKIQKQLVVSRYDVSVFYGEDYHKKIDRYFTNKILNKQKQELENMYKILADYMKNKDRNYMDKKDILLQYLMIRSYYELHYRMK